MESVYHRRLYDSKVIKDFLTEEEIWSRISEYGQQPEDFVVLIVDALHWIGLFADGKLIGILWLHEHNNTTAIVHINIHKEYRYKYSLAAGAACIDYMLHHTDYNKFNTEVPVMYPAVIKYLTKFGFSQEGVNRKSINKDNAIVDQFHYGITRDELSKQLTLIIEKL